MTIYVRPSDYLGVNPDVSKFDLLEDAEYHLLEFELYFGCYRKISKGRKQEARRIRCLIEILEKEMGSLLEKEKVYDSN